MRAILILGGIALVTYFYWTFYILGIFLIYTGIKLAFQKEEKKIEIETNLAYRLLSKFIPMTQEYHNGSFFVKKDQIWMGTPLLVILFLIEFTDLLFAFDSVPAILGITTEPFIVYTSNIFAILGLRSLFFVLEKGMQYFYLLHYALAAILIFIGLKMLGGQFIHLPTYVTLSIIVLFLALAIVGSFLKKRS